MWILGVYIQFSCSLQLIRYNIIPYHKTFHFNPKHRIAYCVFNIYKQQKHLFINYSYCYEILINGNYKIFGVYYSYYSLNDTLVLEQWFPNCKPQYTKCTAKHLQVFCEIATVYHYWYLFKISLQTFGIKKYLFFL